MTSINIRYEFSLIYNKLNNFLIKNKTTLTTCNVQTILTTFLKEEKCWNKAGNKTDFNTIQMLKYYDVIKIKSNINNSYIILHDNTQFNIRKQDVFHYNLVASIYKYLKKNNYNKIINDFFIKTENNLLVNSNLIKIENCELTNDKSHFRTDMEFNINSNKIIVEYLEKQHEKEQNLDYPYERYRAFNLLFNNKCIDSKIVHVAYFWDKNYNNNQIYKQFVNSLCKKIIDYYDIENEAIFCIRKLSEIIKNESLAEVLYNAHNNKNIPIIKLESIESLIGWKNAQSKDDWFEKFTNKINKLKQIEEQTKSSQNAFDNFNSDSDSETETEPDSNVETDDNLETIYYTDIDNEILLTQSGLHVYLRVDVRYLITPMEEFKIINFYENITQGLIDSIKEYREKQINLINDIISGLD